MKIVNYQIRKLSKYETMKSMKLNTTNYEIKKLWKLRTKKLEN